MPRTPAQDTPARRQVRAIDSVSRRLDTLEGESRSRVVDWIDGLIDGSTEDIEAEIKAMRDIARQFEALDRAGRESAVRWVNENYAKPDADGGNGVTDTPIPL